MISLSPAPPALSSDLLTLYFANEPLLEDLPVLIFYGSSTTANSTHNSSRIQAHIYSLAGFQTFPRLTIAPTSPLYAAVSHLPSDLQGDEVYRGLAIALFSYFAAIPRDTKSVLRELAGTRRANHLAPMMFDEMHAGDLASKMTYVEKGGDMAAYLTSALAKRSLSWVDVDVILPRGSIVRATCEEDEGSAPALDDNGLPLYNYGKYNLLVDSFGSPQFLPTSKLQRAPSRPTTHAKYKTLSKEEKVLLRREMCELVDTENNYLSKIRDLFTSVTVAFRQDTASEALQQLFPESLGKIIDLNGSFYQEIQAILDSTESEAIRDIDGDSTRASLAPQTDMLSRRSDPTGATFLAKAVLKWFPLFKGPYQDYLRASNHFSDAIALALTDTSTGFGQQLQIVGEQHLRSALIEPVQRLPRYSLLVDNIINLLPASHTALAGFVKARDIITDICALDSNASASVNRTAKILRDIVVDWPERLDLQGRLIVAADINELTPPYGDQRLAAILLVFPGKLVILLKTGQDAISARGLLAELDQPSTMVRSSSSVLAHDRCLRLEGLYDLSDLRLTESADGNLIYLRELPPMSLPPHETLRISTRVFQLQAPYHGKASRLTEEIAKARIEARYPEDIREGNRWALRSIEASEHGIGIMGAISDMNEPRSLLDQYSMGQIIVVVDGRENARSMIANKSGTHIAACLTSSKDGGYVLEIEGADGTRFTDDCKHEHVVRLFQKRRKQPSD
ncbi:MAG: hypothetical protein Q9163_001105 [Psora crenata]